MSNSSMNLTSLPLRVSCTICGSWLVVKAIVFLDSELCNHEMRGKFHRLLCTKELVLRNSVALRGIKTLKWLFLKSLKISNVLFDAETERSHLLNQYFASFGDSMRSVHFCDEDYEDILFLVACYCKNIAILRCTNMSLSLLAFHALLFNNPNIKEIWLNDTELNGLMHNVSLNKLEVLSFKYMDCPKGFPWSETTHSSSLQRAEFVSIDFFTSDIGGMKALTHNCTNLRSLGLGQLKLEDDQFKLIVGCRPELVNLDISNSITITDDAALFASVPD